MANTRSLSVLITSILSFSGQVAIANTHSDEPKDSVESWGIWAKQYATAAGGEINTEALAFARISQNEAGRNSLNEPDYVVEGPVLKCSAGSVCGYAHFGSWEEDGRIDGAEGVGLFDVSIAENPNPPSELPISIEDGHENPLVHILVGFSVQGTNGEEILENDLVVTNSDGIDEVNFDADFERYSGTHGASLDIFLDDGDLVDGYWSSWEGSEGFRVGVSGDFVGGVTTSLAQLNTFVSNLNGAVASYEGHAFDGGDIDVSINFSAQSWSGSFGNSAKGFDNSFSVTGGKVTDVAFTAGSSNLSAATGTVSGIVSGAIFGDNAESVAGMLDVTKTVAGDVVERKTIFAGELQNDLAR